jgi:hypothetical protein
MAMKGCARNEQRTACGSACVVDGVMVPQMDSDSAALKRHRSSREKVGRLPEHPFFCGLTISHR